MTGDPLPARDSASEDQAKVARGSEQGHASKE
jgi:hypothetical protein